MTRRDTAIVAALLVSLAVLGGWTVAPSLQPSPTPVPTAAPIPDAGHVEGVLGRPSSITPLTARTQVDRDLVALLFRGLVRLGSGTEIVPDLAESWQVDKAGTHWTFRLRDDVRWHDSVPVTSADVVFTVGVLHDPDYSGPLAATWAQVSVQALDDRTVRFELGDPVGGFLQAATLPLLPAHILEGVPASALADDPFALQPIGNGAFALVELTDEHAVLEPVLPPVNDPDVPLSEPGPGAAESGTPRLSRLELRFFDTSDDLASALAAGTVASAADLPPATAVSLAVATPGARAIRYPGTTLTAITFNLRAARGPFSDARTRRALLAAIDRDSLIRDVLGGAGMRADTPVPPSSWAYDATSAAPVAHDEKAAVAGLRAAGWKLQGTAWVPPGARAPLKLELLVPARDANSVVFATGERVAAAWTSLGLATTVVALPPGEYVDRLRAGTFTAAIIDVNIGLDPDAYPILGSTQVLSGGANVAGFQDSALDKALLAARSAGTLVARRTAYQALQKLLATLQPMPSLFFRDTVVVANGTLQGPVARPIADPSDRFWDVLRWRASGR